MKIIASALLFMIMQLIGCNIQVLQIQMSSNVIERHSLLFKCTGKRLTKSYCRLHHFCIQ
jgi:hypothetical protein